MEVIVFFIIASAVVLALFSRQYLRNSRNLSWYMDHDSGILGKMLRWLSRLF